MRICKFVESIRDEADLLALQNSRNRLLPS